MVTRKEVEEMLADYVTVTLKVPKEVAEWFKFQAKYQGKDLEEWLTAELVDCCFSQVDAATPKMFMDIFNLEPIFKEFGFSVK